MSASKDKVRSSLVNLMALSTVLKWPIFSVYQNTNPALRPLIHGLVHPRVSSATDVLPIYILWSRDSNLDNRSGAVYRPNHFVPLVCNVCTPKVNTASATAPTAPVSVPTAPVTAPTAHVSVSTAPVTAPSGGKKALAIAITSFLPQSLKAAPLY